MKAINISNYDKRDFFCVEILFVALIKYVMMFFNKTINNDANDVVFFR